MTTTSMRTHSAPAPVDGLAADRLGTPSVIAFAMTAAAPLMVIGGVVTVGWATTGAATGITAYPLAFVLVAAVLALFTVGYMAMIRRVGTTGAFYSAIAHGAGRPAGVAAALVATGSYQLLQVGLYGIFGATLQQVLAGGALGGVPWWGWAGAAWLVVGVLGLLRVDVSGTVLMIVVGLEIVTVIVFNVVFLGNPAGGSVSMATLDPGNLFQPGVGAVLVTVVTAFVGFEAAAVYSEESRRRRRTVPVASFAAIGIMVLFYAVTSWAIAVTVGEDDLVTAARDQQTELMFALAADRLGTIVSDLGTVLLLTSVFAAMLSYHNTVARYAYSLAREGVLPRLLARTGASGSPRYASLLQSGLAAAVVVLYAVMGWDPLAHLFFRLGMSGGFGVLLLITATAVAVCVHFRAHPDGVGPWTRVIAPGVAAVALVATVWVAVDSYGSLLGVPPGDPAAWLFPLSFAVLAGVGLAWGCVLRRLRPAVYERIGRG